MATLTVDFFSSLDGNGSARGWPGYWGKEGPERLAFTYKAIADAQELDPKWDYKQAIDTSLVEK